MVNRIRLFLALEAAIFIMAALIDFEVILDGYLDQEAGTTESIIAVVLLGDSRRACSDLPSPGERASLPRASPWPEHSSV